MSLIVQKYGGTSVGSVERIQAVAERVAREHAAGHQVVVVVSAMSVETDRLLGLAKAIQNPPSPRELDSVLSTGEQVTIGLLAMALEARGVPARSYTGAQVRILTDSAFNKARIEAIDAAPIASDLAAGKVVVVAGFQGVEHLPGHFPGMVAFMIHVHQDDQVEGSGRELRIGDVAQDRGDVGDTVGQDIGSEDGQHLRLDVVGVDMPQGADRLGQTPGQVAAAGADVAHAVAGRESEGLDQSGGFLLVFPFLAFEPRGSLVRHEMGDLPAQVPFTHAVEGAGAVLVGRFRRGLRGHGDEGEGSPEGGQD